MLLSLSPAPGKAQTEAQDLTNASLEELMSIKVTSATRKEEKLSKVPAAIYVITQDEIRRSGAYNIPDLLRMVPGLDVAQLDANSWAISARGFNDQFANKLLVLIDGRTVYDPTFSGVFWDVQNVPLEDIERIEVIRGPGASVWGANAVNGVINIITKSANATQGGTVVAGGGSERAQGLAQYGGKVADQGAYRVFATYSNDNSLVNSSNRRGADGWHQLNGGFRSDLKLSGRDSLMLEGNVLDEWAGQTINMFLSLSPPYNSVINEPISIHDGNVLGRWTRNVSARSDIALQFYYDNTGHLGFGVHQSRSTADLDFQHHYIAGARHDIVWGLGYRFNTDEIRPGNAVSFIPPSRSDNLFSGFFQDEIRLTNSTQLTLGSKLEHNAYSGFEIEPSIRFLWSPDPSQAVWAAVSRAVRQPSREDDDLLVKAQAFPGPGGIVTLVTTNGNPNFRAEDLLSYEAGYRSQLSRRFSVDLASFYNVYSNLKTSEPGVLFIETSPRPVHLVIPTLWGNKMFGATYGTEVSANWQATDRWTLTGAYSWLQMNLYLDRTSLDTLGSPGLPNIFSPAAAGVSPAHQWQIRSYLNLPRHLDFDTALYYVSNLPALQVPAYLRVDARLGWRVGESSELSLAGQNLLGPRHLEFGSVESLLPTQPTRSIFARLTFRF